MAAPPPRAAPCGGTVSAARTGELRSRTCRTRASTEGSIRRVKAGLATPITIASTTSGTSTAASRAERSGSPWFFGLVTSP